MATATATPVPPAESEARGRRISSIWVGIGLMIVMIVYSALGSAIPPLRQYFELSEMAWFGHWMFGGLVLLFCAVLVYATLRRIRFNLVNLGVLTVHAGLLLLAGGSLLYFGGKIEGDVMLQAPRVVVVSKARLARGEPAVLGSLVASAGRTWETDMPMAGGAYRFEVRDVRHAGMLTAADVMVDVTTGTPPTTSRFLLSQPEPGDGAPRAATSRNRVDVNEHLALALEGATQIDRFYHADRMALKVRALGRQATFNLDGLPRYGERVVPGVEALHDIDGAAVQGERSRPIPLLDHWTLPIACEDESGSADREWPVRFEVDGYLPYAELRQEPARGGTTPNPVALVEVVKDARASRAWLSGTTPASGRADLGPDVRVEFRWVGDAATPPEWEEDVRGQHVLSVEVKDKGIRRQFEVTQGQEITIDEAGYRLRVDGLLPDWPLMTPGFEAARSPVAQVSVSTPTKRYQRTVVERYPQLSQDIDEKGQRHREGPYDSNLVLRYADCTGHSFRIAAGSTEAANIVYRAPGGRRVRQSLKAGETFAPVAGMALTLRDLIEKPIYAARPVVIPVEHRQRNAGRSMSLVRVHAWSPASGWSERVWVPFTQYGYADDLRPAYVQAPGIGPFELVYGRQTEALPGPITLEQMAVTFNPGRMSVRDWRSILRVQDGASGKITNRSAYLNHTCRFGRWTFFQSGAAQDHESWTILGVGNRTGIVPMSAGCILITLGLLYAFYVKPVVKARRKAQFARLAGELAARRADATRSSAIATGTGVATAAMRMILAGVCLLGLLARPASVRGQAMPEDDIHRRLTAPTAHDHDTMPEEFIGASRETGEAAVASLKALAGRLRLDEFRLLVVQHGGRYETVEAWARDVVKTVHGTSRMDDLDPVAAALELAFNAGAHVDRAIVHVKDMGIRNDLTSHPIVIPEAERRRIRRSGLVSYRFLGEPAVAAVLTELRTKVMMQRAVDRLDSAVFYFENARSLLRIVPSRSTAGDAPWLTPDDLISGRRGAGQVSDDARGLMMGYARLAMAWPRRDANAINEGLAAICAAVPKMAPDGGYMALGQRRVDAFYSRMNAFAWGWGLYVVALALGIWSVVTGWRAARWMTMSVFGAAFLLHGLGLGLRWYIIGRVPVANMFESVVASAWLGAAIALGLELRLLRARQVAYLLPLCAAIILEQRYQSPSWYAFAAVALGGLIADMVVTRAGRTRSARSDPERRGVYVLAASFLGFMSLALGSLVGGEITTIAGILDDVLLRIHTVLIIASYSLVTLAFGVANCYLVVRAWKYGDGVGRVALGSQVGAALGLYPVLSNRFLMAPGSMILTVALASAVGGIVGWMLPILAARRTRMAAPGNPLMPALMSAAWPNRVSRTADSPVLTGLDLSQMTLLNMANVGLFAGMILGAVWADYSWGRPWGWDPKEVFALTTWLIYAILIHVRYVTRDKGLWSAVVAVVGFAMMMFNWWAVNFFIVGLHSYA